MLSKESANVLLQVLFKTTVSPMQPGADATYAALTKARNELAAIVNDGDASEASDAIPYVGNKSE